MVTTAPTDGASAVLKARVAGFFYLLTTLAGLFYMFAGQGFYVAGDAAATAQRILSGESFYRIDITSNLVAASAYVVVTMLLYDLLAPVSRPISRLAAFFSMLGIASMAISFLCDSAPLYLLSAGTVDTQTLSMIALKLSDLAFTVGLIFFGFYCALIGWLLFRSVYFPKLLGVLMAVAGACYLIDSFTAVLVPTWEHHVSFLTVGSLIGESALTFWLLIVGLNTTQWRDRVPSTR